MGDQDREFIWTVLADTFASIPLNKEAIDRLRKLPIGEIRRIFFREVSVACSFNLTVTTPEIDGFDPQWIKAEISRILEDRNSSFLRGVEFEAKALFSGCVSFGLWRSLKKLLESQESD
ncbi:DUF7079 family protein [Paraburkholderia sp. ZP32-5]|uniref:DUF7079 family protein n=1 Tax=Paraburkholderia sp. ZP32-5 TaxID=2883245 RepID=UPI001F436CE3|nr:hypothetical protein [Paraburkholderia sp. ZP32-5]